MEDANMQLTIPAPHHFDKGRVLTPEERESVKVTPILEIQRRCCQRLGDNSRYRPGKSRR